eukprot:m.731368 g.731368  ORF g.731368 m.731368 type:complete len:317 (-) comp58872_c0_seq5:1967-2917(-)
MQTEAKFEAHSSIVKGLAWDPVDKYLISQADDHTAKIWRVENWSCEATISLPALKGAGVSMFLRPAWAPDGLSAYLTNASNSNEAVSLVVSRESLARDCDLSGHRVPVVAAVCLREGATERDGGAVLLLRSLRQLADLYPGTSWLQRASDLFLCDEIPTTIEALKSDLKYSTCVATADQAGTLAIWRTPSTHAYVVIKHLFQTAIHDLSWSQNGRELYVCSDEGSVAFIHFKPDELGKPLSDQLKQHTLNVVYGSAAREKHSVIRHVPLSSGFEVCLLSCFSWRLTRRFPRSLALHTPGSSRLRPNLPTMGSNRIR